MYGNFVGSAAGGGAPSLGADLTALEALASTGLAARTGDGTWAVRTITGTTNQITVTNGNGVSGNPTIALSSSNIIVSGASVQFNRLALGASFASGTALYLFTTNASSASQWGLLSDVKFSVAATTAIYANDSRITTEAASFTCPNAYNYYSRQPVIGATSAITNFYAFYASTVTGPGTIWAFYAQTNPSFFGGNVTLNDINLILGTTTGTKIGTATGQKLGFWNATPVVQQVLATGASATVDNVISLLQTLGLCKQS